MATIKSFTSLEQSRKLAKILPLESADMMYHSVENEYGSGAFVAISKVITNGFENDDFYLDDIPCWSLAALLEQLPYEVCDNDGNSLYLEMDKEDDVYQLVYTDIYGDSESIETDRYEHFVDACYDMILKLHELNLL